MENTKESSAMNTNTCCDIFTKDQRLTAEALALCQRVLQGGRGELDGYVSFLRGGCSKFPLALLRDAGVDMESPAPVNPALQHFGRLVDELDELL